MIANLFRIDKYLVKKKNVFFRIFDNVIICEY